MSITQHCLAVVSGTAGGLVLGTIGGGGSILATPLLLYVVGLRDVRSVIGTAALSVALTAWLNVLPHARAGNVRWADAAVLTPPGVVGAVVGQLVGRTVPSHALLFLFALLIAGIAARMIASGRRDTALREVASRSRPVLRLGVAGLGIGVLAGFFGIGGGFLVVPVLVLAGGLPPVVAVGTSLVTVGALAMTTSVGYALTGQVAVGTSAEYVAGGIFGGYVGSQLAMRLGSVRGRLTTVFAVVLLLLASYMLLTSGPPLAHRLLSVSTGKADTSIAVTTVD